METIKELKENEYYYVNWSSTEEEYLFKHNREGSPNINITSSEYYRNSEFGVDSQWKEIRLVNNKEKHWLNKCIELNKFVSKEIALKDFNQEKPFWVAVTEENIDILKKWKNLATLKIGNIVGNALWTSSNKLNREWDEDCTRAIGNTYTYGNEITFEEFLDKYPEYKPEVNPDKVKINQIHNEEYRYLDPPENEEIVWLKFIEDGTHRNKQRICIPKGSISWITKINWEIEQDIFHPEGNRHSINIFKTKAIIIPDPRKDFEIVSKPEIKNISLETEEFNVGDWVVWKNSTGASYKLTFVDKQTGGFKVDHPQGNYINQNIYELCTKCLFYGKSQIKNSGLGTWQQIDIQNIYPYTSGIDPIPIEHFEDTKSLKLISKKSNNLLEKATFVESKTIDLKRKSNNRLIK